MTNSERDEKIAEMHADIKLALEILKRHDKTLYDDAMPGLCTRVQILETSGKIFVSACAAVGAIAGSCITVGLQYILTK